MADDWEALVAQVKEANDIVDVVGSYVALRQTGRTFKGLCPFHDDSRPSFDVDPVRQRYRCWSCGKMGDVYNFIQEHDRVDFRDALEVLARRAGISLEKIARGQPNPERAGMIAVVGWAAEQFQRCLLESPLAAQARAYLAERRLADDTIRRFGLGYAPALWNWLDQRAVSSNVSREMLDKVGLLARRDDGSGYFDRFRDRVLFPIRDARGTTVGFGGRILPTSPQADTAPKYYNSAETSLFRKSELLYGLDQARQAAAEVGYLAVVEGYTDVLMAHQHGVRQVVATMGTALNARHVRNLRRFVGRVVLVFDADEGGEGGVDRALEIFASQDVELAIARLPQGLDPCDLLVREGAEPFRQALADAVDALDYKLERVASDPSSGSVEGKRRALDAVLTVIALAPEFPGETGAVKRELMVGRMAQRLGVREETVWARLGELRQRADRRADKPRAADTPVRKAPAAAHERELLQVLLADPELVPMAAAVVAPGDVEHPGLRQMLAGLYDLHARGEPADLDRLRVRIDNPSLVQIALEFQEIGRANQDRSNWLQGLLREFRRRQNEPLRQELHNQLHAVRDHTEAVELFRRLQQQGHP